ncbi:MAG: sugar ABC transporter substrate-binding protein [Spirochaetales bacterium]|nr:sugar ABC transporter substrate-binding protein [Spirochaetales bacterium]
MKRIMTVLFMVSLCFTLSANGGGETESQGPVTLKFASWSIQEKNFQDYFMNLKEDFEAANPSIKVEFNGYPYGELKKQVLIMANAGQSPDIIQCERSWYSSFVSGGYVAEMEPLMGADYMGDIYPEILEDMKVDGKAYGVPWIASPFVLFYNRDLFAQAGLDPSMPPSTYEEALQFAEKISALTDRDGNGVYALGQTTGAVPVSGGAVLSMFFSYGGGIRDAQGKVSGISEGNRAALNSLKEMYEKGYNPEGAKLKDLRNLMAIGRLGMYFDQLWGIGGAYAINPDMKGKVGVALPLSGNGAPAGSTLEAHMLLISEDSGYKKEAAEFIRFATSTEQMGKYSELAPFLFPRTSQVEGTPVYRSREGIAPVLDYPKTIHPVEKHPEMENVFLALTTAAQMVTVGGASADEAMAALDKELKDLLK